MAPTVKVVALHRETVLAFDAYIRQAEAGMQQAHHGGGSFLWSDASPDRARRLEQGEILAQLWTGSDPVQVPHGLIHDWVGAASIPGASVERTLELVQDYDNHRNIYKPDVIDSKLISRCGDDFKVYLRLLKKKIITVVLETDHDVRYSRLERSRWYCVSRTTRIAEVQDAGKPNEVTLPADTGHGFLWRLYSYWKFQGRDDGTLIECRAVSLTRDIPAVLRWIIQPMVRSLPKDLLFNTLAATRRALAVPGKVAGYDARPGRA
ncbi:MAG: hypothetical protein ABSD88_17570 [Candidatus Korobacteraceae bacterium]|jgi:hypothetical protein